MVARMEVGFWTRGKGKDIITQYVTGNLTYEQAAQALAEAGVDFAGLAAAGLYEDTDAAIRADITWYARKVRKGLGLFTVRPARTSGKAKQELIWTFDPPYPEVHSAISPKVIVVGAEPNDNGADQLPRRDMGVAIRVQLAGGEYQPYHQVTLQQVRAVAAADIASQSDEEILKHLRYVDLKATGGGGSANKKEVAEWVRVPEHRQQVVGYWLEDRPAYTVLQGRITQEVFEKIVAPELRAQHVEVQRVGLPHPSRRNANYLRAREYLEALKQVRQRLRPLSEPLQYWAPKKKAWETR